MIHVSVASSAVHVPAYVWTLGEADPILSILQAAGFLNFIGRLWCTISPSRCSRKDIEKQVLWHSVVKTILRIGCWRYPLMNLKFAIRLEGNSIAVLRIMFASLVVTQSLSEHCVRDAGYQFVVNAAMQYAIMR